MTTTEKKYKAISAKIILLLILFCSFICPSVTLGQKTHDVFFEGTDYELHIYKLYGKTPGKTMLLIGGIQGNEPGGFLSADLYADIALEKGNLIVVPRANFLSILMNRRQINEDMNRKFGNDSRVNFEKKIVSILKKLIAESDCLLNLHDGSGFYSDKWEGPNRNPKRYGQSIIADCETFYDEATGTTIKLGELAKRVIDKINSYIKNPKHFFHFANHRTAARDTSHAEQRQSATYYALYQHKIPAFGIESSKSLPLAMKVRHHNLAINAFMELFDIVPENPGIYLDPPVLKYLVVVINNNKPIVVANRRTLHIRKGDTINISHLEANYERGLSIDILNYGTVNDYRKNLRITESTQAVVRKDHYHCGKIDIVVNHSEVPFETDFTTQSVSYFILNVNGKERIVRNMSCITIVKGDTLELVNVETNIKNPTDIVVNFKGFIGNKRDNTGEDRGYLIHTDKDLMTRYSLNKKGLRYQVIVYLQDTEIGKLFVNLKEPLFNHLIVELNQKEKRCIFPGETLILGASDIIKIVDIKTNIEDNIGVYTFLKDSNGSNSVECTPGEAFQVPDKAPNKASSEDTPWYRILVQRENRVIGWINVDIKS
ncbi:MAG: hypothetical protein JRE23_01360 [Deltaproteobacteria bacterium]|nr:hypothetical protein [Deltaproteobacteria bacterium]